MIRAICKFISLLCLFLASACGKVEPTYHPVYSSQPVDTQRKLYSFGITPSHNPQLMLNYYQPILNYLNSNIEGVNFRLKAVRNNEEFEQQLYGAAFDFALANPYQVVRALKRDYRVFGKRSDDEIFRGLLVVRRDSAIRQVSDLKDKKVSFPSKTALAPTMMTQYFLQTNGLDVNKDIEPQYVGSQESSIMSVFLGNVAAAGASSRPWAMFQRDHPNQAAQLKVMWTTEPLIQSGLLARADMPPALVKRVGELFSTLHETAEGRTMLEKVMTSGFEPANDATYDVVQVFLDKFTQAVRPLPP